MTKKGCDEATEKRFEALNTYQKWQEGMVSSYLRSKYQPVAFERWYYDAPKIISVPGELKESSLTNDVAQRIGKTAEILSTPEI